jgi:hypothetical protein
MVPTGSKDDLVKEQQVDEDMGQGDDKSKQ